MFYSQCLVSRKGALGTVWVAAHCLKRLKKDQVAQINISSSVDKILLDEVPVVTHRVLAFLLLGVVKIYSKKVEYLFDDCHRVIEKINDFAGIKKASKHIEGMRAPRQSITRPKRLELDEFDLQILEDGNGDNVRADEDITLADAWTNDSTRHYSSDKNHNKDSTAYPETCSADCTPVKDVLSPYIMEKAGGSSLQNLSSSEPSIEKLRIDNFSLEDRLDPMFLGEVGGEPELFGPPIEKNQNEGMLMELSNKRDVSYTEEMRFPEMASPESGKHQTNTKDLRVSIAVDVISQCNGPRNSGATTPELVGVQTPAIGEHASVFRKRKCLFDDTVVLSNKVVKESINDSSSLVCKRRKIPHTALHAWKAHQISNLPRTFLEPLFPCISLELKSLFYGNKLKSMRKVEKLEALEKINISESPTSHISPDEAYIAPSTPDTQSVSLRLHDDDDVGITNLDRVGPTSSGNIEKEVSPSEEEESDGFLTNEDINLHEGDNQEADGWSDRTRLIARQLCRSFSNRRERRQPEGMNLSQILKKKTKSESARFFYETLVLKTGGYIDVTQNAPYGDILVLETPKLKQACETGAS